MRRRGPVVVRRARLALGALGVVVAGAVLSASAGPAAAVGLPRPGLNGSADRLTVTYDDGTGGKPQVRTLECGAATAGAPVGAGNAGAHGSGSAADRGQVGQGAPVRGGSAADAEQDPRGGAAQGDGGEQGASEAGGQRGGLAPEAGDQRGGREGVAQGVSGPEGVSGACGRLGEVGGPLGAVPEGQMCSMVYGGPQTAHVTGRWHGAPVDETYRRTNGCEIARWNRMVPVLPVPGAVPAPGPGPGRGSANQGGVHTLAP